MPVGVLAADAPRARTEIPYREFECEKELVVKAKETIDLARQ